MISSINCVGKIHPHDYEEWTEKVALKPVVEKLKVSFCEAIGYVPRDQRATYRVGDYDASPEACSEIELFAIRLMADRLNVDSRPAMTLDGIELNLNLKEMHQLKGTLLRESVEIAHKFIRARRMPMLMTGAYPVKRRSYVTKIVELGSREIDDWQRQSSPLNGRDRESRIMSIVCLCGGPEKVSPATIEELQQYRRTRQDVIDLGGKICKGKTKHADVAGVLFDLIREDVTEMTRVTIEIQMDTQDLASPEV